MIFRLLLYLYFFFQISSFAFEYLLFSLWPFIQSMQIYQQVRCFNVPLQSSEIAGIKSVVQQKVPEGVNSLGLTFPGFVCVHNMFLKKGRPETLWAVLRNFGYDNNLKLKDDFLPVPAKRALDQVTQFLCYITVKIPPLCLPDCGLN